jgi:ribosomal protein L37E
MIYDQMLGEMDSSGHVLLLCRECGAPAQDARSLTVLKVCSRCGIPLGQWITETERDTELKEFAAKVKQDK